MTVHGRMYYGEGKAEAAIEPGILGRLTLSVHDDGGFYLYANGVCVEGGPTFRDLLATGQFYSDGTVGLFPVQGDDLKLREE